jgi:hypothetical protein
MHVRDRWDLLPLRQMVRVSGDAARVFARQGVLDGLSKPNRFRIVGHGEGGQILAAGELALAEAGVVLRRAYGELVSFATATIHTYREAGTLMVPVMFLRIDAPRAHMRELLELLHARCGRKPDVDAQRHRTVLRAEVELSRGLDLHGRVHALTDGAAHVLSWLQGYQPAPRVKDVPLPTDATDAGIDEGSPA